MRTTLEQLWTGRVAGAVAAASLGLGVLAGCGDDTAGPEAGASVEDIQEDESAPFVGQTVTVSADVNEIITARAFTIAGTEPLLVISGQPGFVPVTEHSAVAVTGTVRQAFDIAAVEDEFGFDYDDALFEEFDGEPYIIATKIDQPSPSRPSSD